MIGEPTLAGLEWRRLPYLFKLRQTANIKRHIERMFFGGGWVDAGQGWEGKPSEFKLAAWSRSRRVIVLQCPRKGEVLIADARQQQLTFVEKDSIYRAYEHAVLVNDLPHDVAALVDQGRGTLP